LRSGTGCAVSFHIADGDARGGGAPWGDARGCDGGIRQKLAAEDLSATTCEEPNFIMTDNIAFWLSGGSLLVAFASLVVALMAKKQARQAALLMSRTEVIAHLRQALGDLNRNGLATGKTVDSIQKALDLTHLVFGKEVRKDLEQAHISARLVQQGQDMDDGIVTLKEDLSKLIAQMNDEAVLVRARD
jgi:hypothetical protein